MDVPPSIQQQLDSLPTKPGCYLMRDEKSEIIYVGKAVNLRSRVRSYWHAGNAAYGKTAQLVLRVHKIEFIVVTDCY